MITIQENISLALMTSFRIGGNALYYTEVKSLDELKEALIFAKEKSIDFYVIGGGTNLLVSDNGFNGLIIRIKMNDIRVEDSMLFVEVGVPLIKVMNVAAENGLSGLENLAGVPGTFGGAIRGNVGAFGSEIKDCVYSVVVFDAENFETKEISKEECCFGYRSSIFKKNKNLIVISAKLRFEKLDSELCKQKVKNSIIGRSGKSLHGVKSAGLFFMNPKADGNPDLLEDFAKERGVEARNNVLPAAWVIKKAGLSGKKNGGAVVSEENTNYIINSGDASGQEVADLAENVKKEIRDKFGIDMQAEVEYLGF